jgi:hypothetical protein
VRKEGGGEEEEEEEQPFRSVRYRGLVPTDRYRSVPMQKLYLGGVLHVHQHWELPGNTLPSYCTPSNSQCMPSKKKKFKKDNNRNYFILHQPNSEPRHASPMYSVER